MRYFSAINRKLIRDLLDMRGQGFAVAIIIACGVAIMVMALGTQSSLQLSQDTYYERYRFADVFATVKRAPESLSRQIRDIDGVQVVETRIVSFVTLDIEGFEEPSNAKLISLPDQGEPALNRVLLHLGRWPDNRRPEEVVISKSFADAHGFSPGHSITAILNGIARDLEIVGIGDSPEYIYTLGPGVLLPDEKRFGVFWMRRKALEAAFDLDGAFNDIALSLSRAASRDSVIDAVDRYLDPYGGIGAYDRPDQLSHAFIESEMNQLKAMARIIPPIFLTVSALLINAILARLIATERQQIGILKAFGYTRLEIGWHYVKMAMGITVVGIVMGFALGGVLARLLTNLYATSFKFPVLIYYLSPVPFVIGGGAAIMAAVIGALNSAMRAARMEPAEAMIPAPPASYRRGWLQSQSAKLPFDEPTRMILRHITRWPGRALTTLFGVAASVGLLVGTLFAFDSIDEITETFFYRTDAYEAAFNFVEPLGNEAITEFSRLPGVMAVEPTRIAAVRLRNGPRYELAPIYGLSSPAQFKKVIGPKDKYLSLPKQGIILSNQLSGMLAVGQGEMLRIEFLEGRRPVLDVPVTSVVDEYIGAIAYMDKAYLNSLLLEGDVVTGGFAKIDPGELPEFQKEILDRPVVSSVALQSAAIASFETTLEETISIMMTIYALIGGAIAAGVVYNAARIALTERGRELASMRVLGFSQGEVSYILLGELALIVLAALPVGMLMGYGMAYAIASSMATELFRIPMIIDPSTYGLSVIVVLAAGFLSAMFVIRRVSRLDMIEVLKTRE